MWNRQRPTAFFVDVIDHSAKQALERFVGRLAVNDSGSVVYRGSQLLVPPREEWKAIVLSCHGAAHRSPQAVWQEVSANVLSVSVGMHAFIVDLCASLQLLKVYTTTQRKLGITKDFVVSTVRSACPDDACRQSLTPSGAPRCTEFHFVLDASSVRSTSLCRVAVSFGSEDQAGCTREVVAMAAEEKGVFSAVLELQRGSAYHYHYVVWQDQSRASVEEERDRAVIPSKKREIVMEEFNVHGKNCIFLQ